MAIKVYVLLFFILVAISATITALAMDMYVVALASFLVGMSVLTVIQTMLIINYLNELKSLLEKRP